MSSHNTPLQTTPITPAKTPSEDQISLPVNLTLKEYRIKLLKCDQLKKRINDIGNEPLDETTSNELEIKLELLEGKYKMFDEIQSELECLDESHFQSDDRVEVENLYCSAKAKLLMKISLQKPSSMPLNSTQIGHNESLARPNVNLPKLQLPTFNGQQKNWLDFFNMFSVMVDSNEYLAAIEKFQYLRSCLEGDAAQLVQSLEVTAENYYKALKLLSSRYDNKRYIFNSHLQEIFKIETMSNVTVQELRKFVDNINANLRALQSFASKTQVSDGIILHLIVSKLTIDLASKWEEEVANISKANAMNTLYLPSWNDLSNFLERKCQTFDMIAASNSTSKNNQTNRKQSSFLVSDHPLCILCDQPEDHNPFKCTLFLNLDPIGRYELVKRKNLCLNCLLPYHISSKCPSKHRCQQCRVSHHTLLHRERVSPKDNSEEISHQMSDHTVTPTVLQAIKTKSEVIIATALVELSTNSGKTMIARALLDSASQLHFVTERVAQFLHLSRQRADVDISGIGVNTVKAFYHCCVTLKSIQYSKVCTVEAIILPSITSCQPHAYIDTKFWKIPKNLELADPNFNQPSQIDILIGTSVFYEILMVGQIKLQENLPILQKTSLGWIVAGSFSSSILRSPSSPPYNSTFTTIFEKLNNTLERFWLIEDNYAVNNNNVGVQEEECETYFQETTTRCPTTNRFIVRLSFKSLSQSLGTSYDIALKRFLLLEKRLQQNPELHKEYSQFINEYIEMGHMKRIPEKLASLKLLNFIPHHCVTKNDSSTTRLRVVFDASCKTANGVSLNEILRIGPTIQYDLFTIIFRFRQHKYVLMADIAKMFRQILVHPDDTKFQCILWRNLPGEDINAYQLQTVTYGTSCATYLATRCLQQLAKENMSKFPIGSKITLEDFYVDNLMTGADSIEEVLEIKNQVTQLLATAGLPLRKFASNVHHIIEDINLSDREPAIQLHDTEFIKALGLKWSPNNDLFLFSYETPLPKQSKITKRKILSQLATFFDPLGFINPIIVSCKILMQNLWKLQLNWDESVPQSIATQWESICQQLSYISRIRIPRLVQYNCNTNIHAFADASTRAYGACIYAVCTENDIATSSLMCAKSRVSPTKPITLPRLELSAALLLSELLQVVCNIQNPSEVNVHCWSDSTITLAWIKGDASRWTQFVSNRVIKIQNLTARFQWHYCPTELNPADIVSRGAKVVDLIDNKLWFEGPDFLKKTPDCWPRMPSISQDELPDENKKNVALLVEEQQDILSGFKHINNYNKLLRIFSYVLRFIALAKGQKNTDCGPIKAIEHENTLLLLCKLVQRVSFPNEYHMLSLKKNVNHKSKLAQLSPFMEDGIIRVGGRLKNSSLPYNTIHPIVLPSHHLFVRTLITHYHRLHMHAGTQTLNSLLRDRFWIINARNTIRRIIHNCIICYRCRPIITQQIMGQLPRDRIEPSYPFAICDVDYCGPFSISHRIRGKQPTKVYIAVFICFTTKAVHMELAMDLTTISFIAALKRFISRRGKCNTIYSDNATNFVGANRELKMLLSNFLESAHITAVDEFCKQQGITWKFIPPRSPHFGGLWESAVKQAKYCLKRVVGTHLFTYDELQTVCCQAEAVINSRPLTPLSTDPDDMRALTPSHFLIGRTAHTIQEPPVSNEKCCALKRYQQIQWSQQCFWERWRNEYLKELQRKSKWTVQHNNLKPNDLVVVKEDNAPPLKWQLGRVVEAISGPDNKTRVVMIKTADGLQKRAVAKVCRLPIEINPDS